MAGKSSAAEQRKHSESSTGVKTYLLFYNSIQVVGWAYVLFLTVSHFISGKNLSSLWDVVKPTLLLFQNAALLEVLNVALGFVKSNLGVTFVQVMSRVILVCGALWATPTAPLSYGLPLLLIAWSITEVIRYSFYALNIIGAVPYFLIWCRYTFFYALYPMGVTGELLCLFAAQSFVGQSKMWTIEFPNCLNFTFSYRYLLLGIMATYPFLLPHLYMYMINQRKKIIVNPQEKKHS
uniref:Very-long-chain (3R)-3-hydroxyacyl-CoA dehydratase n=1 Tax=Panstrongylus lignarius TaxID=156445 RepID=A0A224XWW1_9HEMI